MTQANTGFETELEDNGVIVQEVDASALALLNKSEIDMQIATAKKYPRSITTFIKESTALVTLSEVVADECIYALPRREFDKETKKWITKNIEGPSARFAEVIGTTWGNNRAGARVVSEEKEFINAQGFFYDLERNVGRAFEVRRRITDSNGNRYKTDMIGVTGNAAVSIAFRNSVLKSVPKAFWGQIYDAARKVVIGDLKTLDNRRLEAIAFLQKFGITEALVLEILGVKGIPDISGDHLLQLRGMATALKNKETTLEDIVAGLKVNGGKADLPTELKRKSEENTSQESTHKPEDENQAAGQAQDPTSASTQTTGAAPVQQESFDPAEAVSKIISHEAGQSQASPKHSGRAKDKIESPALKF